MSGFGTFRPFELHRDVDVSGVSGTGVVATGQRFNDSWTVGFPDGRELVLPPGWVVLRWRTEYRSTVLWPSLDDVMAVHGHHGSTRLVWTDVV